MGSRRTYAVDSDLCLCRCVNRLITKFWRRGLSSFVLLRLPAAISFGGLGELCSDLQWLRGARGSLTYREPSHFQELKQLGCFFKVPYLWNVFSIPLQHITIDGHIADQISRLWSNAWSQAAVLSTCNRFELYFASPEQKSWTWLKISWVLTCSFRRKILHPVFTHMRMLRQIVSAPHSAAVSETPHIFLEPTRCASIQLVGTLWQQRVPCEQEIHHVARSPRPPPTCRVSVGNSP